MQNTCNLANCTLLSAHLIRGAMAGWSDFSVLIFVVGCFWQGKWTSAWGLGEVRKTSQWRGIVIGLWLQLSCLITGLGSLVKPGRACTRVGCVCGCGCVCLNEVVKHAWLGPGLLCRWFWDIQITSGVEKRKDRRVKGSPTTIYVNRKKNGLISSQQTETKMKR